LPNAELAYLSRWDRAARIHSPNRYIPVSLWKGARHAPSLTDRPPAYRKHKPSGQAVVTIAGRDVYLGPHGTKTSRADYDRVVGEWLAAGRPSRSAEPGKADLTVAELIVKYWHHAETYYRHPDGTPTSELAAMKLPMAILTRLYGRTPAAEFGPLALAAVRDAMIQKQWGRASINTHAGRLKRIFKWAVSKELIPPSVSHGLSAVAGLRAGRSPARETDPVRHVSDAAVAQTLPFLTSTVAAIVRLQLLTGARPGEICSLRTADIDRTADVWIITPRHHKTAHHGHERKIFVGRRGQDVLNPFLKLDPDAFLFSPVAAEAESRAKRNAARVTPPTYGNRAGTNRKSKPKRRPGEFYGVCEYRRAIARACDFAFPPPDAIAQRADETAREWRDRLTPEQREDLARWRTDHRWHPHRLRHTAATAIRREFGIEAAQHVLGHASLSVTEIYAEKNSESARAVAAAIG
jgi:integrase